MKFRTAFLGSRQTKRISTGSVASVVGIVCMNRELGDADALSVGIYLPTPDVELNRSWTGNLYSGFASRLSGLMKTGERQK